ncbi:beta-propeller fold lactonase family protein [Sphingomonas colocasiae]|uniref:Beta-propeller fold lactonase family protein n=1 Tax=Sphingomonas colocasiae TaxID=1848973 RepID=A0ABS7PXI2_9SPHN|nr:beta-propeller fold lactonase family protein [Sphingomonas colocasiae]MBY8826077.1 beta-propeller fold lactonase family protein [Sphingomonas colocasiae]
MRPFVLLAVSLASSFALAVPAAAETLLIGNKAEDTVSFIDLATGKERARVETAHMPHEIAISPDGKQAAVVAYGGTTLDIFDVASASRVKRIDLSPNVAPHGIAWLRDGRLVVTTEKSKSLTLVDPATGAVSAVATDQNGSHMVAIAPTGGRAYVANIASGTVSVIDIDTRRKIADIAVGGRPEGIALTPNGKQLWVGDLSAPHVRIVDTATLKTVATLPVDPVAIRVAISPDGKTAVTSNLESGTLTLIDVAKRKVLKTISVSGQKDAGQVTILFSRDGKRLYAAETYRNEIAEVDMKNGTVLRRIPAGKNGDGLGIAP